MNKDDLKFKIDQLRKDKIIYATEACAIVLICILSYFFTNQYFSLLLKHFTNVSLLVLAAGYTIYMGVGNFIRLRKIQSLEKEVYK